MLKTVLILFAIAFFSTYSFAQLQKTKKNGKYGFVDKNGQTVIEHKYDYVERTFNRWGLVKAQRDRKEYFLDVAGNEYLSDYQKIDENEAIKQSFREIKLFPKEVLDYRNLKILILRANEIPVVPAEIAILNQLVLLDLSENKLKELPSEIGELKELTFLDIFGNDISQLPEAIGMLTKLKYLAAGTLGSVRLKELPAEIGKLVNLKELQLRFTEIEKIPKELGTLTQLKELDLLMNGSLNFSSLCKAFENYPKKVIISENVEDYFTEHPDTLVIFVPFIEPFEALKIENLIELQTYGERGAQKIAKTEIDLLRKVEPKTEKEMVVRKEFLKSKSLNWSGMRFTKVPETILMFQSLEILDLSNNDLLEFPERILLQMKGLKKLNISGNPVIMLSEKAIAFIRDKKLMPVDSVEKYNVSADIAFAKKGLSRLPDILWEQDYLAELHLDDNKLSTLPKEIANLKELNTLYLNNNLLEQLPGELGKMEHLTELFLENNNLTKLPDFSKLQSLVTLNLKNNKLTTVAKSLKKLKYLAKLNISGNKIPKSELEKLKKWLPDCEIVNSKVDAKSGATVHNKK